jgi:ABC-type antimicrobial peptide transport system permease subunit
VAVVSASAARKLWPDQDPIGQQVRPTWSEDAEWLTVVGVVADVRQFYDVVESWYLPYAQHAGSGNASSATFAVRTTGAAAAAAPSVRAAMTRVAPDLPLEDLLPATALHQASLTRQRQGARLSAAFSAFGLLLAAMGLYGAIAYTVNRRRREFGIRLALGCDARGVVAGVLRQAMGLIGLGVALGAVAALGTTQLLAHALETVQGFDPVSFGVAVVTMSMTAVAAVLVPARRAARLEPAAVLREE